VFGHVPCPELDDISVGIGEIEGTSASVVIEGNDLRFISRQP
jgi:hypothetical protein